jgi:hypothetical protein
MCKNIYKKKSKHDFFGPWAYELHARLLLLKYYLKIGEKMCEKIRPIMIFLGYRLTNFAFTFKQKKRKIEKKIIIKDSNQSRPFWPYG